MSNLSKSLELNRIGINKLPLPEEAKEWLKRLCCKLEETHVFIRDSFEAGGAKTKTWRIVENSSGDLKLQHLESGSWVDRGFKYTAGSKLEMVEAITLPEITAPGTPAENKGTIYLVADGDGTQTLVVKFDDGTTVNLAAN